MKTEIKEKNRFDSLEQEAFLNIVMTYDLFWYRYNRFFRKYGISGPQYGILRIIKNCGEARIPVRKIAEKMWTKNPDVTRQIDLLEKSGLVERVRGTKDRRIVWVKLTDAAHLLMKEIHPLNLELHKKNLAHLGEHHLKELIRLLTQVRRSPNADID